MIIKKALLKISGEYFAGKLGVGVDFDILRSVSQQIKDVLEEGFSIALVVGGGNIYRGSLAQKNGLEREKADYIGMLGTVINALSLGSFLSKLGMNVKVMSMLEMGEVCEPFNIDRAMNYFKSGNIVMFAAGTGNPYFSTDTAAILKGLEMHVDVVIKCTKVDGVYSQDPVVYPNAEFLPKLTYDDVLMKNLGVMDLPAISLAKVNNMPIIVGSIKEEGNILKMLKQEAKCTIIR